MSARLAEHRDEQVRATVDHLGMIGEIRRGVDHAEQLDDAPDAGERTKRVMHDRQQVDAGQARAGIGLLKTHFPPNLAGVPAPIRLARALTREEQQLAFAHMRDEIGDRRRGR